MDRQSLTRNSKPDNSRLLSASNLLQRPGIDRTDYRASTVANPDHRNNEPHFGGDFSKIPAISNTPRAMQPKLKIGQPNDKYEQEADRVADQVMRMTESRLTSSVDDSAQANNLSLLGAGSIQRLCAECPEDEALIQTKSAVSLTPEVTPVISSGIQSLQGDGQPMSEAELGFFEPRFGADFSNVRVHHDSRAATSARLINARAFTFGHDVVFGAGEYVPATLAGQKLFAHELTHVVQQSSTRQAGLTTGVQHSAGVQIQGDWLDDLLGENITQFARDLGSSIYEAPTHFGEILGEVIDTVREHWLAFSATLLGFLAAEAVIAALAGAPEPTTATKWAAFILQALMLLIIGAFAAVELGQVVTHTWRWISAAWEARGDPSKISEASRDFCRVLLHAVLLILTLIGVRTKFRASSRALETARAPVRTRSELSSETGATGSSAARTRLGPNAMRQFVQQLLDQSPVLQRLANMHSQGGGSVSELRGILTTFEAETGVVVEEVANGAVQAQRGAGNLASLRSRPGYLQIERQVFENPQTLLNEVTHELAYHYSRAPLGHPPRLGESPFSALELLEMVIKEGGNVENIFALFSR